MPRETIRIDETRSQLIRQSAILAAVLGIGFEIMALFGDWPGRRWYGLGLLLIAGFGSWQLRYRRRAFSLYVFSGVGLAAALAPLLNRVLAHAVLIALVGIAITATLAFSMPTRFFYVVFLGSLAAVALVASQPGSALDKSLAAAIVMMSVLAAGRFLSGYIARTASREHRYQELFETAGDGIVGVDSKQRIVLFNERAEEIFGYSADEIVGKPLTMLLPPEARQEHPDHVRGFADGDDNRRRMGHRGILTGLRSDGREVPIEVTIAKRRAGGGWGFTAIVRDVSDQVRTESALAETLRSKETLIASISHELRTPLTAVLGFAQVLQNPASNLSAEDRAEMIDSIISQGNDLSHIVDDLLVAAKAETGGLRVVAVQVDLRAQIAQVLEEYGGAHTANIELTGDPESALGDPARVRQIIRNLVTNAMRYGGESIHVRTRGDDTTGRVLVVDDGPGVPTDYPEQVFAPYWQGRTESSLPASLGLGLSLSRQLARAMNGDLTYRRVGGETVFELSLPRAS